MAQVRQTDKRTGIVYVYEAEAVWDPERKQTRYGKRKLIGHIDRETGELVPNRPRRASADERSSRRAFFGTWALLSEAARESGLKDALASAVGEKADTVLAIAGYMVSEVPMPLSRFSRWAALHDIPVSKSFDMRSCAELLASLGDPERDALCASLMRADGGGDLLVFEIAPIASYEQAFAGPRCGADCCPLAPLQVNLAVLVDRVSGMPLCYHRLHGPVADGASADELLSCMGVPDKRAVRLAMGRGFWSTSNVDAMMETCRQFLVELPPSADLYEDVITRYGEELEAGKIGDVVDGIRGVRIACTWSHGVGLTFADDVAEEGRPCYVYLFFDPARRTAHETAHATADKRAGYQALFSNEAMEPFDVLAFCRGRRAVEKRSDNMEGLLDLRVSHIPIERMLPGGLFVAFVASVLAAWLQKRMRETGLDRQYALQGLLDEVETIERFTQEGRTARIGTVTTRQRAIFEKLGYSLPSA